MLECRELTCVRGDRPLFEKLSFVLAPGSALHVVGANGTGKTSLMRLVCGLSVPAAGAVLWQGERIRALQEDFSRQLIYVGHAPAVKDDLTAVENLQTACTLAGLGIGRQEARQALARIGLAGREDLPTKVLSQGQRRRVVLARLLLATRVPLWVLDEPFTALDKQAVNDLRQTIDAHVHEQGMVIYTTHQDVDLAPGRTQRLDLDAAAPC